MPPSLFANLSAVAVLDLSAVAVLDLSVVAVLGFSAVAVLDLSVVAALGFSAVAVLSLAVSAVSCFLSVAVFVFCPLPFPDLSVCRRQFVSGGALWIVAGSVSLFELENRLDRLAELPGDL